MLQIKRAGHSTLTTPDIERMVDYFTRIVGLSLATRGEEPGNSRDQIRRRVDRPGTRRGRRSAAAVVPGRAGQRSRRGRIAGSRKKASRARSGPTLPPASARRSRSRIPKARRSRCFPISTSRPRTTNFNGVMPLKFGHIAYQCPDVQGMVKFYCDVLGFRVSDWRGDFFAFLRCSRDHHTVNFLRNAETAIHHIAFEVRDWSDIKRACDCPGEEQYPAHLGPDPPHHRPQYRDLSQESRRRGHRVLLRHGPDVRRGARFLRAAALASGPAAAAEGLGRRNPVELVGADVARFAGPQRCGNGETGESAAALDRARQKSARARISAGPSGREEEPRQGKAPAPVTFSAPGRFLHAFACQRAKALPFVRRTSAFSMPATAETLETELRDPRH